MSLSRNLGTSTGQSVGARRGNCFARARSCAEDYAAQPLGQMRALLYDVVDATDGADVLHGRGGLSGMNDYETAIAVLHAQALCHLNAGGPAYSQVSAME